jgi:uncharacterized membrane protein YgaE (UPF0421/DUF939 family)
LTAAAKFEKAMRDLAESSRELLQVARRGLVQQDVDPAAAKKLVGRIMSLSSSLDTTLQAARVDSKRFRSHFGGYQRVTEQLHDLAFASVAIFDASLQCGREEDAVTIPRASFLRDAFDSLDDECVAALEQMSMPRDGTGRVIVTESVVTDGEAGDRTSTTAPELRDAVAISLMSDRIMDFRAVAARVRSSLAEVESTPSSVSTQSTFSTRPALRARLSKSALACLQVVMGAWFFIALDWPLGLQSAMVAVMALAYMNAQLPIALLARTILLSVASALPLAAVFHFLIMPGTDAFSQLAPWLALFFLPYLYVVASSNPLASLAAIVSIIIAKSLISVSTTPPSYEFASFANTYLGLSGGFSLVLLLAYLFETRSPRRGFVKLLTVVLSRSAAYLEALNVRALGTSETASEAERHRKQSLQNLRKLKSLSATVDYRKEPHTGRDQVESLLQAYEVLALRLTSTYSVRTPSEPYAESDERTIHRIHLWCTESLTATERALSTRQPIAIQNPPDAILEDLQSSVARNWTSGELRHGAADAGLSLASLATYYRSLAEAIVDCQRKLESVDWNRWCRNRF